MRDKLDEMFILRKDFMSQLNESIPGSYPSCPLDLSRKESQQLVREYALRGVEEMFEALAHLKNWKSHRYGSGTFDREEFLEEVVDAFNYFISILCLVGVDSSSLFEAYNKKHAIICERVITDKILKRG